MYAIQNIKTGEFVYGTDYRYGRIGKKHNQLTSKNKMLTYDDYYEAAEDFRHRGCGKNYRIVVLKTVEVKRVIDFDKPDRYMTYWEYVELNKSGGVMIER